jgi:hypothetical protein
MLCYEKKGDKICGVMKRMEIRRVDGDEKKAIRRVGGDGKEDTKAT